MFKNKMKIKVGVLTTMKFYHPDFVSSVIYLAFKYINYMIIQHIGQHVKQYNIIALKNLENDLLYMFKLCGTHFSEFENLMECLREVRQFLDLFLVAHPKDLLDPVKR